jgi:MFS family permease
LTDVPESGYAWYRLLAALLLAGIGGVGMWSVIVALPAVQAEFAVARSAATLPYTVTMISFGFGGIFMGRLSDRFGIFVPVVAGTIGLSLGYALASQAVSLGQFTLAQGVIVGVSGSIAFAPLIADTSLWFTPRRRGRHHRERELSRGHGVAADRPACHRRRRVAARLPRHRDLLRVDDVAARAGPPSSPAAGRRAPGGGACRVTIAAAARHVAGRAPDAARHRGPELLRRHVDAAGAHRGVLRRSRSRRGARMLSMMLGFGIVSRLASGWVCDRIGGRRTLLLGSALQALALVLFLPFDGLVSLYILSALFGLVQGGIVPSYAVIIREFFAPEEAGVRVGTVLMATVFGMALGGWMSGVIFDATGSYQAAFLNGIAWNLLNVGIAVALLRRPHRAFA